jgi:hypothetical protein
MADETDVESTIVGLIATVLYPNGTSLPSAANVPCKVMRGWPSVGAQEEAKANNFVNVSVSARSGVERNTTRYPPIWITQTPPVHTLTASVSALNVVTIGGIVAVPQNVLILVGQTNVFNYAVQPSDTLTSICSSLATLIAAEFAGTTSSGHTIIIPTGMPVQARIAAAGTQIQEVGRQEKSFQVTVWAPPTTVKLADADLWRTAVAALVGPHLRQLIRIVLPDQTYAHIYYDHTMSSDSVQTEGLYRRDMFFWVEYATTLTAPGYEIGVFGLSVQAGIGELPIPDDIPTVTSNF